MKAREPVLNAFRNFTNSYGSRVLALILGIQLLNAGAQYFLMPGSVTLTQVSSSIWAGIGISGLALFAGLLVSIGSLKVLRDREFSLSKFKRNLLSDGLSFFGAIITVFLLVSVAVNAVILVLGIPVMMIAGASGLTLGGPAFLMGPALVFLLSLIAMVYSFSFSALSIPETATGRSNAIEGLKNSYARTKGHKWQMLPGILIYFASIGVLYGISAFLNPGGAYNIATALNSVLAGFQWFYMLSLLTELDRSLPERER